MHRLKTCKERLQQPVDGAGLAVVRFLFGMVMTWAMLRFLAKGWVEQFFHQPSFHFSYVGFAWVKPLPPGWMELVVILAAAAAACLAIGLATRFAAAVFFLLFTWIELCDVSTYLNHYYLASQLALLLMVLPSHACWSCDAWFRQRRRQNASMVQSWHYLALRVQLGLVYTWAGIAKIHPDWLLDGLPMAVWLPRHADVPLIGFVLAMPAVAIFASWFGMLYDLSIPWLLSWRRSRGLAYVAVVFFHLMTWLLFPIGMFPWLMIAGSLIFLPPSWPRRWFGIKPDHGQQICSQPRYARLWATLVAAHLGLQALLPWRSMWHPGDVRWHEQGFRFSWRVMLMEKTGDLRYRLQDRQTGEQWLLDPGQQLAPHQVKQLETQPDLILQFAHELARQQRQQGREVAVYAESWCSLNGAAPQRLIKPTVDLSQQPNTWDRRGYVQLRE